MKLIAIFLSYIMILNLGCLKKDSLGDVSTSTGTGRSISSVRDPSSAASDTVSTSASALSRLKLEKTIFEFVKKWNQSSNLIQVFNGTSISQENKTFLMQVLKSKKMENFKPPLVEYIPKRNQFLFSINKGVMPVWILATEPSLVLYDKNQVLEFHSESQIQTLFPEFKLENSDSNLNKKKIIKNKTSMMSFFLSKAQAELIAQTPLPTNTSETFYDPYRVHNEQIRALEKKNKKVADRVSKDNQNQFKAFLIGLGLALTLPTIIYRGVLPLINKVPSLVNPHWGSDGKDQLRTDISKLKRIYPDIENEIFDGGPIRIKSFECEAFLNENSPVSKVSYTYPEYEGGKPIYDGRPFNEVNLNLIEKPSIKDSIIKSTNNQELGIKVSALEKCCQSIPCEKWLKERMKSFDDQLNREDSGSDEEPPTIEEFIETKEKAVR